MVLIFVRDVNIRNYCGSMKQKNKPMLGPLYEGIGEAPAGGYGHMLDTPDDDVSDCVSPLP